MHRPRRPRPEGPHNRDGSDAAWIASSYVDLGGVERIADPATRRLLHQAISSEDPSAGFAPPVVQAGTRELQISAPNVSARFSAVLQLEGGGEIPLRTAARNNRPNVTFLAGDQIPLGVHKLLLSHGSRNLTTYVLARPRSLAKNVAAFGRRIGVFLPLYAVPSDGLFGVGTYRDLGSLCEWAGGYSGALFGTLPLFPSFLDKPFDPSPYSPISRLMWNELFIEPRQTSEWEAPAVQRVVNSTNFRDRSDRARRGAFVDYRLSWKLARELLSAMATVARSSPRRWSEIAMATSMETMQYASFRAAVEQRGCGPEGWPASWRSGGTNITGVKPSTVDLYIYSQAIAAEQVAAIRNGDSGGSLYLDLPVGVHANGFDTYLRPDLFLQGISAGAPPDGLNASGQVWGFPPLHPTAGRADGYAHLRAILRRMFSIASVLRIDHVMGLYRMYCVPAGFDGTRGAYIRYPEQELFAIVMIEAARAKAVLVGEDLGTVPPEVRRLMRSMGLLGLHVQQFGFNGDNGKVITDSGPGKLASLNTHDTPSFAGFWRADDVQLRRKLGHINALNAHRESADRASLRLRVTRDLSNDGLAGNSARDVAMALMRRQARGKSPIVMVNLEDVWGERQPQNVPGTIQEYPNWRRRASKSLQAIMRDRHVQSQLNLLLRERRRKAGARRR